jgi:hypothetical protein
MQIQKWLYGFKPLKRVRRNLNQAGSQSAAKDNSFQPFSNSGSDFFAQLFGLRH